MDFACNIKKTHTERKTKEDDVKRINYCNIELSKKWVYKDEEILFRGKIRFTGIILGSVLEPCLSSWHLTVTIINLVFILHVYIKGEFVLFRFAGSHAMLFIFSWLLPLVRIFWYSDLLSLFYVSSSLRLSFI